MFYTGKNEFIITSEREDGVIQFLWRSDRTFDQVFHTQVRLYIFTLIAYVDDRMADRDLKYLHMYGKRLMTSTYRMVSFSHAF